LDILDIAVSLTISPWLSTEQIQLGQLGLATPHRHGALNTPVTAISEWSDDQPQSVAEIFITIFQFWVDHSRLQISVLYHSNNLCILSFQCFSMHKKRI